MEAMIAGVGAFFAGAAAALVYAGLLWLTIRHVIIPRRSAVAAAGSFLLRTGLAAAVLCAGVAGGAVTAGACLLGFFVAHRCTVAGVRATIA